MDKTSMENMSNSIRLFLLQYKINISLDLIQEKIQESLQKDTSNNEVIVQKQELELDFGSVTPMFRQMLLTVQMKVDKIAKAYVGRLYLHYNYEVASHGTNGTTAAFIVLPTTNPDWQEKTEYIVIDERIFFAVRNWQDYLEKQK